MGIPSGRGELAHAIWGFFQLIVDVSFVPDKGRALLKANLLQHFSSYFEIAVSTVIRATCGAQL